MHNRNNILVIEDQKSLATDVVKYLGDNNYKCTHVTSIKNARHSSKKCFTNFKKQQKTQDCESN